MDQEDNNKDITSLSFKEKIFKLKKQRFLILGLTLALIVFIIAVAIYQHKSNQNLSTKTSLKIKHIIIIMQENRSFDTYFGTYPGANGLPSGCINDPQSGKCIKSYHEVADVNGGGPHGQSDAVADIDGGKMDGFIAQAEKTIGKSCGNNPECAQTKADSVMGYHDRREIPNYWAYANNFVLQDAMFQENASWSLPEHLFLVSEWSAKCSIKAD